MKRVEFIEIDIDYCSLSYGVLPCPVSGGTPCFNTKGTCQARPSYQNEVITLRFAAGALYLDETGIDIVAPCIERVSYTAGEVSLGENLGKRASLSVEFSDFPHSDTGRGFDKYHSQRPYDPFKQGTFWGKFRSRHPFLRGRALRWIQGHVGQAIDQMETRHFILENFDGPTLNGRFNITAKDVLKLADDDRVKVPVASRGYLLGDINSEQKTFNIGPVGIGSLEYPASGFINIAGKEICRFTRSGDTFTIVRGSEGTLPSDHKAQDRIQLCKEYEGLDPSDIISDLLRNFAKIPQQYIPIDDWRAETATYLRRRYSRIIAEPMGVSKAISELIQQAGLMVWWDESTKLIRLKVMRAIDTEALIYDDENMLKGSFKQKEKPDTRVSQVMSYFGKRTPLERDADPTSYHSLQMDVNLEAESDYGDSVVKTLHSSWIPQFGRPIAKRLNEIILGRFVNPPREFNFSTFRGEQTIPPLLGDGYRLFSRAIQSPSGGVEGIPVQVTRIVPKAEGFDVSAVEMRFTDFSEEDLNDRTIIIDGDYYNFNWRSAYDRLYPPPTPDDDIVCYVSEGAIVGSQILSRAAFEVGNWPAGCKLRLFIRGRIQGRGGDGGEGRSSVNAATHGKKGGTGLYTRFPIRIEQSSQIWGGGGGGGAGIGKKYSAGGGGGGQGFSGGFGGGSNIGREGHAGGRDAPGRKEAQGGRGGYAGQAGEVGRRGGSGGNAIATQGGAAGNAIDGNSYLSFATGQGDIRGPRIN